MTYNQGSAVWEDGLAANLEAAAADALYWYRWFQAADFFDDLNEAHQEKLSNMIETLSEKLTAAGVISAPEAKP